MQTAIHFQSVLVTDQAQQILRSILDSGGDSNVAQQRVGAMLQGSIATLQKRIADELSIFDQSSDKLLSKLKVSNDISLQRGIDYNKDLSVPYSVKMSSSEYKSSSSVADKVKVVQAGATLIPFLSKISILGQFVPVLGPVLAIGLMLFGGSNDDRELRAEYRQEKERRAARERAVQHIANAAQELGNKFERETGEQLLSAVSNIVRDQINSVQNQMQGSQDTLMTPLQQLQSIKTKVELALNQVSSKA